MILAKTHERHKKESGKGLKKHLVKRSSKCLSHSATPVMKAKGAYRK
jgi:hypothetical protein